MSVHRKGLHSAMVSRAVTMSAQGEANMPAIEKADPALALEMRQHTADVLAAAADIIAELSGKK